MMDLTAGVMFQEILDSLYWEDRSLGFSGDTIEHHSYATWGMILVSRPDTGQPEPKIITQEIPGMSGVLDLTEATSGFVRFTNRTMVFRFRKMLSIEKQMDFKSELMSALHGKRMLVYLDEDPNYFYVGRVFVSSFERQCCVVNVTITVDAEPFKRDLDGMNTIFDIQAGSEPTDRGLLQENVSSVSFNSDIRPKTESGFFDLSYGSHLVIKIPPNAPTSYMQPRIRIEGLSQWNEPASYERDITSAELNNRRIEIPTTDISLDSVDLEKVKRIIIVSVGNCEAYILVTSAVEIPISNGDEPVPVELFSTIDGVVVSTDNHRTVLHYGWNFDPYLILAPHQSKLLFQNGPATIRMRYTRGWL